MGYGPKTYGVCSRSDGFDAAIPVAPECLS